MEGGPCLIHVASFVARSMDTAGAFRRAAMHARRLSRASVRSIREAGAGMKGAQLLEDAADRLDLQATYCELRAVRTLVDLILADHDR